MQAPDLGRVAGWKTWMGKQMGATTVATIGNASCEQQRAGHGPAGAGVGLPPALGEWPPKLDQQPPPLCLEPPALARSRRDVTLFQQ